MSTPTTPLQLREALDDAVRCLAVSASPMRVRLHAAGTIILGLTRADFVCHEDGELFDQIATTLTKLGAGASPDHLQRSVERMSDVLLEEVANAILELRDTLMGRAICEAEDLSACG